MVNAEVLAEVPAGQSLEIRLLGEPQLVRDGKVVALPASKKSRALLGYLVKTGRPQRRERLCELLWDGPDDPRAALRWSLAKLRPLTDAGRVVRIIADREHVSFEARGAQVDVLALQGLRPADLSAVDTERLREALSQFGGEFLEGLELVSCPAFHAWCVAEREALRTLHVKLLTVLVEREREQPARALEHARALVALDPVAESPRLMVLDLLAAMGERRRARDEYDDYVGTLQRELGVKPSRALLQRRMHLAPNPSVGPAAPPTAVPACSSTSGFAAGDVEPPPSQVPFVGRQHERHLLERLLETVGHGPSVLLVSGEPGMGKTRLLEELARLARERGGLALAGRAFEAELVRPYGAFIDALRSGLAPAPGGAAPTKDRLPEPFNGQVSDRTRLYDGVLELLAGWARERAPLVLVLDDLHWLDEASAGLFHYLARALGTSPVLLAASARKGELGDNPAALRLVRALGREGLLRGVDLGPLDDEDVRALLSAACPAGNLEHLVSEAGGSPLFALESARAVQAGSEESSGSLARIMAERLGRLQGSERSLLSWAGALGRSFDVDILARVTGLPATELLTGLERLEHHGVLRSRDSGYDFAHDLLRHAAYRQLSSPRQRLVHAQIARALWSAPDPEGALAGDVAHHAALAGDVTLAARACVRAARRCLRMFASREARELALRGGRIAQALPDSERVSLLVEFAEIQLLAEPRPDLEAPISHLTEQARELGLAKVEARALFLQSVMQFRSEESRSALESALQRVEAARHTAPSELGIELAGAARCCLLLEKSLDLAAQLVAQAEAMLGENSEQLDLVWAQGMLAQVRGHHGEAAERMSRALRAARREHAYWEECECLTALVFLDLDQGEADCALTRVEELSTVAGKLGESSYSALARSLRALIAMTRQARHRPAPEAPPAPDGVEAPPPRADRGPFAAFDHSLTELGRYGANRLLAVLQNRAARMALRLGAPSSAHGYAQSALEAAQRVERLNEVVAARVTLAEVAILRHEPDLARKQLEELSSKSLGCSLSARTAQELARMQELVRSATRTGLHASLACSRS